MDGWEEGGMDVDVIGPGRFPVIKVYIVKGNN